MVTRAVIRDDRLDEEAERLARTLKRPRKEIKMVLDAMIAERKNNKRQPKPPAPEGGISLRAAERKYGISNRTFSNWVRLGYIPVFSRTKNELYVDEAILARIANQYKSLPSTSRRTIRKVITAL